MKDGKDLSMPSVYTGLCVSVYLRSMQNAFKMHTSPFPLTETYSEKVADMLSLSSSLTVLNVILKVWRFTSLLFVDKTTLIG